MASDAACGLAFLHSSSNQIAHRDFNTSNLLVTEDMRVKIADFGLSRLVRAATSTVSETSGTSGKENEADGVANAGVAKATVSNAKVVSDPGDPEGFGLRNCLFHAPEVIAAGAGGVSSFGTRADVFSFGVVLWCLATLAPPWEDVQAEHEHLPELARFYQTMRAVAKKVAAGERLPPGRLAFRRYARIGKRTSLTGRPGERDPVVCLRGKHRAVRRAHRAVFLDGPEREAEHDARAARAAQNAPGRDRRGVRGVPGPGYVGRVRAGRGAAHERGARHRTITRTGSRSRRGARFARRRSRALDDAFRGLGDGEPKKRKKRVLRERDGRARLARSPRRGDGGGEFLGGEVLVVASPGVKKENTQSHIALTVRITTLHSYFRY